MNDGTDDGALHDGRTATRVTGAVLVALASGILVFGDLIRPGKMAKFFEATSPGLIPAAVLAALAVCGLVMILRPDAHDAERFSLRSFGLKVMALLYFFAYTSLLPLVGWLLASLGLLLSMPILAGYRNPVGILVSAVLVLGSIWSIFVVGIGAPLP